MTSEYEKQANDFLEKTGTTFKATFYKWDKYFDDDKVKRDIYNIELRRASRIFYFTFGNSLVNSGEYIGYTPEGKVCIRKNEVAKFRTKYGDVKKNKDFKESTAYDILACLQKNEVGTFQNFCDDFGYTEDSRKAEEIYNKVVNEWNNVKMLWNDKEITLLQEIQ